MVFRATINDCVPVMQLVCNASLLVTPPRIQMVTYHDPFIVDRSYAPTPVGFIPSRPSASRDVPKRDEQKPSK